MSEGRAGDGRLAGRPGAVERRGGGLPERRGGDPPSPWEGRYGFSRVVSAGQLVIVGGTTSVDAGGAVVGETEYEQTMEILRKLAHELARGGARLDQVVQIRAYVTDISRADDIGRAHGEVFGQVRPVMTMVEVSGLIDPRMLVEIEVMAVVGPSA